MGPRKKTNYVSYKTVQGKALHQLHSVINICLFWIWCCSNTFQTSWDRQKMAVKAVKYFWILYICICTWHGLFRQDVNMIWRGMSAKYCFWNYIFHQKNNWNVLMNLKSHPQTDKLVGLNFQHLHFFYFHRAKCLKHSESMVVKHNCLKITFDCHVFNWSEALEAMWMNITCII